MKNVNPGFTLILAGLALSLASLPPVAQAMIRQIDSETLVVVDYRGKPPFERRYISREASPAEFARFEELAESSSQPQLTSSGRSGPPGKSLPIRRMRMGGAQQVAEFARFEESSGASSTPRIWRGVPGKGRPLLVI